MKRKGELFGENIVGILIAVIGLGLVVGIIGQQIYRANVDNEGDSARKTLDGIIGKIENLQDGETGSFAVQGFTESNNWYLVGFDSRVQDRPDKCFLESCVCICKNADQGFKNACQNEGFCRFFDDKEINVQTLFDEVYIVSFGSNGGNSVDATKDLSAFCIHLPSNLFEVMVSKDVDSLSIVRNDSSSKSIKYVSGGSNVCFS